MLQLIRLAARIAGKGWGYTLRATLVIGAASGALIAMGQAVQYLN